MLNSAKFFDFGPVLSETYWHNKLISDLVNGLISVVQCWNCIVNSVKVVQSPDVNTRLIVHFRVNLTICKISCKKIGWKGFVRKDDIYYFVLFDSIIQVHGYASHFFTRFWRCDGNELIARDLLDLRWHISPVVELRRWLGVRHVFGLIFSSFEKFRNCKRMLTNTRAHKWRKRRAWSGGKFQYLTRGHVWSTSNGFCWSTLVWCFNGTLKLDLSSKISDLAVLSFVFPFLPKLKWLAFCQPTSKQTNGMTNKIRANWIFKIKTTVLVVWHSVWL